MSELTILIADDHPIFRKGLRQIIDTEPRFNVVAEASDGLSAFKYLESHRPKIAVLDVDMPKMDGFDVARKIKENRLPVEIVFLTMYKERRFFKAALELGAKGYVLKDSAVTEIVNCLDTVAAGQHFVSPVLSSYLIDRLTHAEEAAIQQPGLASLTSAERRVLKLVGQYKSSKDIAEELCVSVRTVDHHRANIAAKLDLKGKLSLLEFAVRHLSDL